MVHAPLAPWIAVLSFVLGSVIVSSLCIFDSLRRGRKDIITYQVLFLLSAFVGCVLLISLLLIFAEKLQLL